MHQYLTSCHSLTSQKILIFNTTVRTSNFRQCPWHKLPTFLTQITYLFDTNYLPFWHKLPTFLTQITYLLKKTDFFFSLGFFKAGSGMPSSQQPFPGVYPPPHQATVQLSYPLNPGFAGHINTPGMSQFPPYPTSNMPPYPPNNSAPYPGYPPTSQPPFPNPMYPSFGQSSCPYPSSDLSFAAPAPTSFAPQPQPYSPVAPVCVSTSGSAPPSMNAGGHSLNTAGSNVTHTDHSTHTKVRRVN
jgi:hypothetical protein